MNVRNNVYEITKLIANYKELDETMKECKDVKYKRLIQTILNSRYGKLTKHE